jgi:hypothetical protein
MTLKFIYTYRERCKTGSAHHRFGLLSHPSTLKWVSSIVWASSERITLYNAVVFLLFIDDRGPEHDHAAVDLLQTVLA